MKLLLENNQPEDKPVPRRRGLVFTEEEKLHAMKVNIEQAKGFEKASLIRNLDKETALKLGYEYIPPRPAGQRRSVR